MKVNMVYTFPILTYVPIAPAKHCHNSYMAGGGKGNKITVFIFLRKILCHVEKIEKFKS